MSRRQKRKSIRTMLMLGVSGTALASLVATLVYAYSPRLANWQLSPQDIAEANEPSSSSSKNGWTSRLVPPVSPGEGNGSDFMIPTNSEIQVAGLEPGADTVTTGTGEGNPSTGGPGSVGGTFEQTYGNGPQFGGMGGQGGPSGFGGPNGPGGNNLRPLAFGSAPSSGPGGPAGPSNPPSDPPPGKSPSTDPDAPESDPPADGPPPGPIADLCLTLNNCGEPKNDPGPGPGPGPGAGPGPGPGPNAGPGPGPGPGPDPIFGGPPTNPPGPSNPPAPPTFSAAPPELPTNNDCTSNCDGPPPSDSLVAVPEPGALALFLMGFAGIGLALRRRV